MLCPSDNPPEHAQIFSLIPTSHFLRPYNLIFRIYYLTHVSQVESENKRKRSRHTPKGNMRSKHAPKGNMRSRHTPKGNMRSKYAPKGNMRSKYAPKGQRAHSPGQRPGYDETMSAPWRGISISLQAFIPNRSLEKTPSICKHTPLFLCVVDNRNFLIARKYSVFKQKDSGLF